MKSTLLSALRGMPYAPGGGPYDPAPGGGPYEEEPGGGPYPGAELPGAATLSLTEYDTELELTWGHRAVGT